MNSSAGSWSVLQFTRGAKLFVLGCALLFLVCVALRINGSSTSFWYYDLKQRHEIKGLIAGMPKPTRSDEWMIWTPAILAQLHYDPPMPIVNESLGAGVSPLLMSVPARHYSMLFRPQLWGFFFFDTEHGFAWYWNAKIFGLLVSMFLLFLVLMRGDAVMAMLGAAIISYSSFVQWWFSSPAMLPEMLTCWAVALVSGRVFFHPTALWKKFVAASALIFAAINFLLCCYLPFEIPLAYLSLFLFAAFLWQRRGSTILGGSIWLAGCGLVVALLLWPVFQQCRATLEIIAHTSYPGARRGTGGGMSLSRFFFGLLNLLDGEGEHADFFPNSSEASNFLPIWIPAMGILIWQRYQQWHDSKSRFARVGNSSVLFAALAAFLIFFACYAFIGLPDWFCRVTALSFCTEKRSILAIGVAGLMLTLLSLRHGAPVLTGRAGMVAILAIGAAVLVYLVCVRRENPLFLAAPRFFLLFGICVCLGAAYVYTRGVVFAVVLAAALLFNNFLVNPIAQGLPSLLESAAAKRISAIHKADPEGAWASYGWSTLAEFTKASGARVLNGVKIAPNLPLLAKLDPGGAARDIYNRYAYIVFYLPDSSDTIPHFKALTEDSYRVFVSPTHPVLRAEGLRYAVFRRQLEAKEAEGLQLIDALPARQIWIYKVSD